MFTVIIRNSNGQSTVQDGFRTLDNAIAYGGTVTRPDHRATIYSGDGGSYLTEICYRDGDSAWKSC